MNALLGCVNQHTIVCFLVEDSWNQRGEREDLAGELYELRPGFFDEE